MAKNESANSGLGTSGGVSERSKKAALTRAMNAEKDSKLAVGGRYAVSKASDLRASLSVLIDALRNGAPVNEQLIGAIANLDSEVGKCIVSTR